MWNQLPEFVNHFRPEDNPELLSQGGDVSSDLFDNIGKAPLSPLLTLDQEIGKWKSEPDMALRIMVGGKLRCGNPCDWWRVNRTKFPILASVAQIVKFYCFLLFLNFRITD